MESFFNNSILFGEATLNSMHLFMGSWFDYVMVAVTEMGNEIFYTLMLPILYWCYDRKNTIKIGTVFLISAVLNFAAKEFFHNPRPDPEHLLQGIKHLNMKYIPHSPGFPSGHTQGAVSFFGSIFYLTQDVYVKILCMLLILMIPYSRIYLAVHYLGDVLGGYVLGVLCLIILMPILFIAEKKYNSLRENFIAVPLIVIPILMYKLIPGESIVGIMGVLSGFLIGAVYAKKRINFNPRGTVVAGFIKVFTGLAVMLGIKAGLKAILPAIQAADFLRYFLMGFWVTFAAPLVFSKFEMLRGDTGHNKDEYADVLNN